MSVQENQAKVVRKVIILGTDRALLAGFLRQTRGGIGFPSMFYVTGLVFGIIRYEYNDIIVTLQLWTIPYPMMYPGLAASFARGHTSVIIVVRPDDVNRIREMIDSCAVKDTVNKMIVVVGDIEDAEGAVDELSEVFQQDLRVEVAESVEAIFLKYPEIFAKYNNNRKENGDVFLVSLSADQCEEYYPPMQTGTPPITKQEIQFIKKMAKRLNIRVVKDDMVIQTIYGEVYVHIPSGEVSIRPIVCEVCLFDCKKLKNVCIVRVDEGWCNEDISTAALLVIAKAYALKSLELPKHIINQLIMSNKCNTVRFDDTAIDDELHEILTRLSKSKSPIKPSLIDEARRRLVSGKISYTVFNTLKRIFERYHTHNRDCGE